MEEDIKIILPKVNQNAVQIGLLHREVLRAYAETRSSGSLGAPNAGGQTRTSPYGGVQLSGEGDWRWVGLQRPALARSFKGLVLSQHNFRRLQPLHHRVEALHQHAGW